MKRQLQRHVRSNVVGYIALFFALGLGSAWAATELEKNEVRSKHIKNRAVKTKDLAKSAVKSPQVADGSLREEDFAGGSPAGPQGPPGEPGAQGEPGQAGAPATNLWAVIDNTDSGPILIRGSGVAAVQRPIDTNGVGEVRVTFNRDVTQCAYDATGWLNPTGAGGAIFGEPPIMAVERGSGAPSSASAVEVHAYSRGTGNLDNNNYDFSVAVFC